MFASFRACNLKVSIQGSYCTLDENKNSKEQKEIHSTSMLDSPPQITFLQSLLDVIFKKKMLLLAPLNQNGLHFMIYLKLNTKNKLPVYKILYLTCLSPVTLV